MSDHIGDANKKVLTAEEVGEIRERANYATPAPWELIGHDIEGTCSTVICVRDLPDDAYPELQSGELVGDNLDKDLDFIAHSRADVPALCASHEALRQRCKAAESRLAEAVGPDSVVVSREDLRALLRFLTATQISYPRAAGKRSTQEVINRLAVLAGKERP